MSKSLDKAAFLAICDRKVVPVDVPDWGVTVHLRSLSLGEGLAFSEAQEGAADNGFAMLLAYTLCDESGEALFEDKAEGVAALAEKNQTVLMWLFKEALKVTHAGKDTEEERGNG